MAAGLLFSLLLGLSFGLWDGADACELRDPTAFDCPAGWSWFDHHCFVVVTFQKSWAEAEKHCQNLDSHLASFHNIDEYNFLRQTVLRSTLKQSRFWIGGYDSAQEGTWFWSDGSKFIFSTWGSGQPDNAGGNEHCMNINDRGRDFVDDSPCDMTLPFICARAV
ncbi:ladderlectin-like [Poeciliopsis prolifica]|uniref:ladderlectin-like n=1 Tax=Poeciliopsis prolifica TaxID=188132 RepID=UPI00241417FE|nr:ladderlectin-like [Poeciliopsis prolifica]XP_054912733.1 ladderlectin-like [Poeciliopsis prolifica]